MAVKLAGYSVQLHSWKQWYELRTANDQKTWLDTVGPTVTYFEVWNDFFTGVMELDGTRDL